MRKIRSVLGILLIFLSIAGLFFWEWKGREAVLMDEVLVARETIRKGTVVDGSMFSVKGVPKSIMLEGVLAPEDSGLLRGKVASQYIAENGQIVMEYFRENEFYLKRNESIFVIAPSWIAMRSSALRRGDVIDIYSSCDLALLGTFRIAYVKDASEREVRDAVAESSAQTGNDILERPDSTYVIDHIEIISTLREYENLSDHVHGMDGTTPAALIIVQRGDPIGT